MIDGNSSGLWDSEITKDMIDIWISENRCIKTFPNMSKSLYDALRKTTAEYPRKAALIDDFGETCTYEQLLQRSEELAAYLYGNKSIKWGSHVGIMMYNTTEFCVAFLALSRLGAVTVPLPSKFKQAEVLSLAQRAEVELIICDEVYADWFEEVYPEDKMLVVAGIGKQYGYLQSYQAWEKRTQDIQALTQVPEGSFDDTAIIMFTSGTTSQSKGVLLKNYNVMHAVEAYRRILHITDKDISVIATPIYHITGLVALLGLFITVGGTLYLHKFFEAKRVIEDARKYGFTFVHASPTVFNLLIQEGEDTPEIPTLRSFACGSSNMMKDKLIRLHKWLPKSQFHTVYGLTETTSPAAIFPGDAASSQYIGSSGIPIPGLKFKIVDEAKKEVPDGTVGEIAVYGSVVLDSYYKQTSSSLEKGWLYTGDLGYFNESHYLYVVDRKKDMINRGGEKIWCFDVENEIIAMEGIQDTAVVGIPDELYGEVAAAVVQLSPESELTEEKIRKYLLKRMAKYKVPVKIRMVERIPQTPNGKTDKRKIKKLLLED